MYARSSMLQGDPQKVDAGIAYMRDEVMPMLQRLDGFVGMSMLVARDTGRGIVTTAWQSAEAMGNSEDAVLDARQQAAARVGSGAPTIDRWEIAVMHRAHEGHDGECARVIWNEGDPANADENLSRFRTEMLPRIEQLPGFCSLSLLIDRDRGRSAITVTYDSRQEMQRVSAQAAALREEFSRTQHTRVVDIAEFDVVLRHLRVPELV
jgi:heme-degrading monooxygenase HmoA